MTVNRISLDSIIFKFRAGMGGEMTKINKVWALSLVIIALTGFVAGYAVQTGAFHRKPRATANLFVFVERPNGKELLASGNTLTDIGEAYAESWLNGCGSANTTARSATEWIAWGNSSIAQTKTILDTEATTAGFERAVATVSARWTNAGDYARNFTITVTATATINLNACGLHWSGVGESDNNLYALAALPQATTFNADDNATAVWAITYDFN
jgi:hypothetical protein